MVLDEAALLGAVPAKVGFVLPLAAGIAGAGVEDRVTRYVSGKMVSSIAAMLWALYWRKGKTIPDRDRLEAARQAVRVEGSAVPRSVLARRNDLAC